MTSAPSLDQPAPFRRMLYFSVFAGGFVTLGIELSASRLLGSVFGTSNLVWANVIGLILLYLAAGYFLGGRWADRSPYPATFYRIMIWSAFLSALIPLAARPVLRLAAGAVFGAEAALALGSFISVLALFAIPVTLLGCISPFAIRLAVDDVRVAGQTVGRIYAISTLGSLLGTFVPVLLLIPLLGTIGTFMLLSAVLYLTGLIGLWREQGATVLRFLWMPLVIAALSVFALQGPLRASAEGMTLLYEGESAYNYIQVVEDDAGYRYLYLNEGQGIHSQWHPERITYGRTWSFFLAAPYFNPPGYTPADMNSVAIIGLAAGTIARQHIAVYGDVPIDGIEIDGKIIEVAAQYFDMNPQAMPSLTTHAEDGRFILNQLEGPYDLIALDAYRPPYIPWHLATVEFFAEVRAKLTDDGIAAINVGRTNTDRRLVDAMTATLLEVFPSVHAMDVPFSFNTILIASAQPTTPENLLANFNALGDDLHPLLRQSIELGIRSIVPLGTSDTIFTDDRAPIETLVDSLVLNFLFSGELDVINP